MVIRKNTSDEPLAQAPTEEKKGKPFLYKVDLLIYEKLQSKKLGLCDTINSPETIKTSAKPEKVMKDVVNLGEKELLCHHWQTIFIFTEACLKPLQNSFVMNVNIEKTPESAEFMMISLLTVGFSRGFYEFMKAQGKISRTDDEYLYEIIPSLFSEKDFEEIVDATAYLLKNLPQEIEDASRWIIEDIEPKKNQINAAVDFITLLQDFRSKKIDTNEPRIKEAAKKLIQEGLEKNQGHQIHTLQAGEKMGIFSPDKELLRNLSRTLNYLDILSYAGYIITPTKDLEGFRFTPCLL